MLMINIEKLNYIQDKYYCEGKLFTGVGFRTSGERVEDVCKFENGVSTDIYRSKYFPNDTNIPHIDIDYIDFTGEYLDAYAFYKNKRFSGIAYELEGEQEFCLGQHLIEDGLTVVSLRWHPSGENQSLRLDREGIVQAFEWFKDGSLKEVSLYSTEYRKILISISIGEAKHLKSVWIEENYFEWILKYSSQLEHQYFESRNSFEDYTVAPTFSLIKSGINDVVFHSIASNEGFKDVSKIIISNTSLTEVALIELASIKSLKQITLSDGKRDLLSIAKELKRKRPDCLIKLDEQKIAIT